MLQRTNHKYFYNRLSNIYQGTDRKMACERCIDIHKAQNIGATLQTCECKCHDDNNAYLTTQDSVSFLDMTDKTEKNTSGSNQVRMGADGSFTPID